MQIDAKKGEVWYIPVKIDDIDIADGTVCVDVLQSDGALWGDLCVDADLFPIKQAKDHKFQARKFEPAPKKVKK